MEISNKSFDTFKTGYKKMANCTVEGSASLQPAYPMLAISIDPVRNMQSFDQQDLDLNVLLFSSNNLKSLHLLANAVESPFFSLCL